MASLATGPRSLIYLEKIIGSYFFFKLVSPLSFCQNRPRERSTLHVPSLRMPRQHGAPCTVERAFGVLSTMDRAPCAPMERALQRCVRWNVHRASSDKCSPARSIQGNSRMRRVHVPQCTACQCPRAYFVGQGPNLPRVTDSSSDCSNVPRKCSKVLCPECVPKVLCPESPPSERN